ncbi:MAG: phospholipid carrier-dependent glycosyltransferase [Thermoanaerobaculia bacterium]
MTSLPRRRVLLAWLAAFCVLFFLELPGSFLFEPDEARYAEIPREMLASGNWMVPRLNFVDYFEKPPLLYWANAASFRLFGLNAYAARLPSRLATLGALLLILLGLRRRLGDRVALASGLIFLSAPLVASLGRMNLTDGVLTFTMAVALVALHEFLLAREDGKSARSAAALVGLGCGLSVLAKGLIGLVLPGAALLLWCAAARRWRRVPEILFSWAPAACLAVTVPYFWAVEKAAPGFSKFFWIHEHFLRYATPEAARGGPAYYFVLTLFAGFLPWSFFLPRVFSRTSRALRAGPEGLSELWFASWTIVILVFFSLSHSKLVPYVFPAAPALAVLLARGLDSGPGPRRGLIAHAAFWTLAGIAGLAIGARSGEISRLGLTTLGLATAAVSAGLFWVAALVSRRNPERSIAVLPSGWAVIYLAVVLALPTVAAQQSAQTLAAAAGKAAGADATVVAYRTYLQGFPWVLRRRIPIYGWKGELEFGSGRGDQSQDFLPRERFLKDWDSNRKIVVLLRKRDRNDMEGHRGSLVAENRKYVVVKNF